MSWTEIVKETLTMREVLDRYLGSSDRVGKYLCPFHKDKNASLSVDERRNRFKCFACNESGDVIDFAEKYFQLPQKDALLTLSNDFNLGLESKRQNPKKVEQLRQEREFERQEEAKLLARCNAQKPSIYAALKLARDVYNHNRPLAWEDFNAFKATNRPERCMWAVAAEEWCLWLLNCLDGIPYDNERAINFSFETLVLGRLSTDFIVGCTAWLLGQRKRKILEKLEKGEIEYLWHNRNITMSG